MKRKQLLGNKGFSLVETMVAIVMLCILFIPISNSFVSSIKASRETKIMQNATATAQTVMEDFKHKTIKDLFDEYSVDKVDGVVKNSVTDDTWNNVNLHKDFSITDNDCCDFTTSIEISKKSKTLSTIGIDSINQYEVPQISALDAPSTQVVRLGEVPYWVIKNAGVTGKEKLRRVIYISIMKDSSGPSERLHFKCTVAYKSVSTGSFVCGTDVEANREVIVDNYFSDTLKDIFLYYTPSGNNAKDELYFDNKAAIGGNLFVIASGGYTGVELKNQSSSSHLDLFSIASNINVSDTGTVVKIATKDEDLVPKGKKEVRRYEVKVTVTKKGETKVYSQLVSVRGE